MDNQTSSSRLSHPPLPARDDCWPEDATYTLIEAWGDRHLELNRGNLRQKHWQEVADAVNAHHGGAITKARRTDIQCKNRIDTLKKKYKSEKTKFLESNGTLTSKWPFFSRLDALIGASPIETTPKPQQQALPSNNEPQQQALPSHYKPLQQVLPSQHQTSLPSKRPNPMDGSYFRKNYSAVAAAAAAAVSGSSGESGKKEEAVDGFKELAQAIMRFGEIYEKVESEKQQQMVELEKQRMEFTKSLEFERMQLFMDTQVQMEKIKRAKRDSIADSYL